MLKEDPVQVGKLQYPSWLNLCTINQESKKVRLDWTSL